MFIFERVMTFCCLYMYMKQRHTHTELLFNASLLLTSHATSISVSFCSSSVIIYCSEDLHFDAQLIDMHASDDVHDQLGTVSVRFDLDKYYKRKEKTMRKLS
jgi:hypothetical protein